MDNYAFEGSQSVENGWTMPQKHGLGIDPFWGFLENIEAVLPDGTKATLEECPSDTTEKTVAGAASGRCEAGVFEASASKIEPVPQRGFTYSRTQTVTSPNSILIKKKGKRGVGDSLYKDSSGGDRPSTPPKTAPDDGLPGHLLVSTLGALERVKEALDGHRLLGIDIETTGLDPRKSEVCVVTLGVVEAQASVQDGRRAHSATECCKRALIPSICTDGAR